MIDYLNDPIDKLLNTPPPKKETKTPPRTEDEIIASIVRADMEVMMEIGRNGKKLNFPDPVRPQWKN